MTWAVLHDWSINGLQQSMRGKIIQELLVSHFCGIWHDGSLNRHYNKFAHFVATPHVFVLWQQSDHFAESMYDHTA